MLPYAMNIPHKWQFDLLFLQESFTKSSPARALRRLGVRSREASKASRASTMRSSLSRRSAYNSRTGSTSPGVVAIQMPPDQPEVKGREAIRDALSRTFGSEAGAKLEEFSVSVKEAEGIGSLIFVRAAYQLRMSLKTGQGDINLEQHGPYINILRKDEEGHWRIYRQIYSRNHPPPMLDSSDQSEPE